MPTFFPFSFFQDLQALNSGLLGQIWRFVIAGVVNTMSGLAIIFSLLYFLGLGPVTANFIGYSIGLLVSFSINRKWTFQGSKATRVSIFAYFIAACISYGLNLLVILSLNRLTELGPYWIQIGGVAVYAISMFLLCRTIVFKSRTC